MASGSISSRKDIRWTWLVTVESQLPPAQHALVYFPLAEVGIDAPPGGVFQLPPASN